MAIFKCIAECYVYIGGACRFVNIGEEHEGGSIEKAALKHFEEVEVAKSLPAAAPDAPRKQEILARLAELKEPKPHHALGIENLEALLVTAEEKAEAGKTEE